MVKDVLERFKHVFAFLRKDVVEVAKLTTPVGQTVTANQCRFISCIARQRVRHHRRFVSARMALGQSRLEILSGMTAARIVQTDGP